MKTFDIKQLKLVRLANIEYKLCCLRMDIVQRKDLIEIEHNYNNCIRTNLKVIHLNYIKKSLNKF